MEDISVQKKNLSNLIYDETLHDLKKSENKRLGEEMKVNEMKLDNFKQDKIYLEKLNKDLEKNELRSQNQSKRIR